MGGYSNKAIGTEFERQMCEVLSKEGYWVHFIVPDCRGAQPFDVIAVRNGVPFAIDCKTCVANTFSISRLEDNQVMAFELWLRCGNPMPWIAVKHDNKAIMIPYLVLKEREKVKLNDESFYRFDLDNYKPDC